jgi:hypothetical protein
MNCLEHQGTREVPVGPERGHQQDPYRDSVTLCLPCGDALLAGDFRTLHARFRTTRTVAVGRQENGLVAS